MDAFRRLIKTKELKFDRFNIAEDPGFLYVDYDTDADIFYLHFGEQPAEIVVHYIDDYIGVLYDPSTLQVVGMQIEAFQYSYVPTHGLTNTWELSDAEQRRLKNTADVLEASERKKKAVAAELDRIAVRPLIGRRLIPA